MQEFGGFEHNLQSLRVVDDLGGTLCRVRWIEPGRSNAARGILKHCSQTNALQLGRLGERFIKRQQPGLEAQLANFADEIAYNNHDVEDGIRAGLISVEQLQTVPLFRTYHDEVLGKYPNLAGRRLVYEILRRMINHLVTDLIDSSRRAVASSEYKAFLQVRLYGAPLVGFSDATRDLNRQLKGLSCANMSTSTTRYGG